MPNQKEGKPNDLLLFYLGLCRRLATAGGVAGAGSDAKSDEE